MLPMRVCLPSAVTSRYVHVFIHTFHEIYDFNTGAVVKLNNNAEVSEVLLRRIMMREIWILLALQLIIKGFHTRASGIHIQICIAMYFVHACSFYV